MQNIHNYINESKLIRKKMYAIKLDEQSKALLLNYALKLKRSEGDKIWCDRMAITFNINEKWEAWFKKNKGKEYEMQISEISMSDEITAIRVINTCKTDHNDKIIVLKTDSETTITDTNLLYNWFRCGINATLKGKIEEMEF